MVLPLRSLGRNITEREAARAAESSAWRTQSYVNEGLRVSSFYRVCFPGITAEPRNYVVDLLAHQSNNEGGPR